MFCTVQITKSKRRARSPRKTDAMTKLDHHWRSDCVHRQFQMFSKGWYDRLESHGQADPQDGSHHTDFWTGFRGSIDRPIPRRSLRLIYGAWGLWSYRLSFRYYGHQSEQHHGARLHRGCHIFFAKPMKLSLTLHSNVSGALVLWNHILSGSKTSVDV